MKVLDQLSFAMEITPCLHILGDQGYPLISGW